MIRHYIALILSSAFALVSFAIVPFALYATIHGAMFGAEGCLLGLFCFAAGIFFANESAAKIVREKTRRNFIAG